MNYKELEIQDMEVIKESLEYSIRLIEGYEYPNYEMKKAKLDQLQMVLNKVKEVLKQ